MTSTSFNTTLSNTVAPDPAEESPDGPPIRKLLNPIASVGMV